ncbi:MAG: PAS domain-containing protein, partial [Verrucomicrobiota bacterium]
DWDLDLIHDKATRSLRHDQCFGYTEPVAEWGSEIFLKHVHPDDLARVEREFHQAVMGTTDWHFECRVIWPDGSTHWIAAHGSIYRTQEGKPTRMLGIVVNITKRKQAEDKLRESEERLQAALDGSGAGTFRWNVQTNALEWDENLDRLFGLPPGRTIRSLENFIATIHPEERPGVIERCERCARDGADFEMEFRVIWPDGSVHWLDDQGTTARDEAGKPHYMTGMCLDITGRKAAEENLRANEERLRAMADAMPQLAWMAQPDGFITWYNQGWYEYTGTTPKEMEGWGWQRVHDPEVLPKVLERWKDSIDTGKPCAMTFPLRGADGVFRSFLTRVVPLKDQRGRVLQWFGTNTDIEDQKRAEENLEKTVVERTASLQETIEQLEEFSYSVSHDLRAPLRAMQGYANAVLSDYGDQIGETGKDYLQRIINAGLRMDQLTQDTLAYSKVVRASMPRETVSLDKLVPEIIQHYPQMHAARAEITVESPLLPVLGNEIWLTQAISNLLTNAVKFVAEGTTPQLRIWTEKRDGQVRLWIKDNGIGIKPEYQSRLFGMFERLDPSNQYEGTGIGLAIVRKSIERMGGTVGLESDGKTGSQFWIQLPAPQEKF